MKGREAKGAPSADLLVCFPSRAHLTLMPKPICSPARPSEPNKRHNNHHHHHHNHHPKKPSKKCSAGQASPLLWAKTKPMGPEITEPTSPKVTCAGQIKVRHKTGACKSWQSVMEEIERIHNNRKHKKKPSWVESIGFKKDIMQFLTCLRNIRFDFRCFGAFPPSDITTDDEEEDEECQDNHGSHAEVTDGNETPRTVFSKWFMVLQENQSNNFYKEEKNTEKERFAVDINESVSEPAAPPPNALLLMRCRSAPAKSWLEEKEEAHQQEQEEEENEDEGEDKKDDEEEEYRQKEEKKTRNLKSLMEEEKRNNKENLLVMTYDTDFHKLSSDIAKETWVVGGMKDLLSRSRSWKR